MDHNSSILNPCHLLLLLLLLQLQCFHAALAQSPGMPTSHSTGGFSTITAALFGTLVVLFFVIALFTLCFHQSRYGSSGDASANARGNRTVLTSDEPGQSRRVEREGVERSLLESFPIMEYAAVRKLSTVKGPLECAVCLSEFADDESLRLLPGCCHVFHPDCIDQWLESHVTCPVCRADVSKMSSAIGDADVIDIETTDAGTATTDQGHAVNQEDVSGDTSASTHTADRFTLRLPRHMIKEIEEARKYKRSVSIAGYAYERKGSMNDVGRSGRLLGFIRSLSNVMRRDHHDAAGTSSRSFKRVFMLTDVAEFPADHRGVIEASSSGESREKRVSSVSEMALLDRGSQCPVLCWLRPRCILKCNLWTDSFTESRYYS